MIKYCTNFVSCIILECLHCNIDRGNVYDRGNVIWYFYIYFYFLNKTVTVIKRDRWIRLFLFV